jgi:hypothetical protein
MNKSLAGVPAGPRLKRKEKEGREVGRTEGSTEGRSKDPRRQALAEEDPKETGPRSKP